MQAVLQAKLKALTALAGSLVLTATVASAAPSPTFDPTPDGDSRLVDLARQQGGGGGDGGGGDGGGGDGGGRGGGDGGASQRGSGGDGGRGGGDEGPSGRGGGDEGSSAQRGGDDGPSARRGGDDGPSARRGGGDGRFDDDGPRIRDEGRYADDGRARERGDRDKDDWKDGDRRRSAGRDHDGDRRHDQRHRVWRNGAWVWVYGPDSYAYGDYPYGDDCGWLLNRATITDSPYWWRRYEECLYD